jgi:hypothetical protein
MIALSIWQFECFEQVLTIPQSDQDHLDLFQLLLLKL